MNNIRELYKLYCDKNNIIFDESGDSVRPYDKSTLFCPAGMQKFKSLFSDLDYNGTTANIQSCIRMNDIHEIGDGSHLLYFNMIGLFSFRQLTIQQAIDFWMGFLNDALQLKIDYVTIHSDRVEWEKFYHKYDVLVKFDDDNCKWSDGSIGGYCTEFFIDDIEIGNIVNPLDDCIDVGFGLERLEMFFNQKIYTKEETLKNTILKIIDSGYKPSNLRQGYVLRKLLRILFKMGGKIDHQFYNDEVQRQKVINEKYERLKGRFAHKTKEWWFDTHGIDLDEI